MEKLYINAHSFGVHKPRVHQHDRLMIKVLQSYHYLPMVEEQVFYIKEEVWERSCRNSSFFAKESASNGVDTVPLP